ncbi:hypothetical protein IFM89_011174 [Coptis chinensis]|uniref:Uncharacterized protein n=1 Tax=Coptis chinensis TaxID=261450 RepID=A0A835HUZ9_9MAGN|nr:hypothetical protein IFM89_011174 [Coptis chinensis]
MNKVSWAAIISDHMMKQIIKHSAKSPMSTATCVVQLLVASFKVTLEEISESSLLVHVVDISHILSQQQIDAVDKVLSELDVAAIPQLIVSNKVGLDAFIGYKVLVFFGQRHSTSTTPCFTALLSELKQFHPCSLESLRYIAVISKLLMDTLGYLKPRFGS